MKRGIKSCKPCRNSTLSDFYFIFPVDNLIAVNIAIPDITGTQGCIITLILVVRKIIDFFLTAKQSFSNITKLSIGPLPCSPIYSPLIRISIVGLFIIIPFRTSPRNIRTNIPTQFSYTSVGGYSQFKSSRAGTIQVFLR